MIFDLKYIIAALFLLFSASHGLMGQSGFEVKEKNGVSTKTLNVNQTIKGASKGSPRFSAKKKLSLSSAVDKKENILTSDYSNYIIHRDKGQQPNFIKVKKSTHTGASRKSGINAVSSSMSFIDEITPLLKTSTLSSFEPKEVDEKYNRVTFVQNYKGIPVYGSEISISLNSLGSPATFSGTYSNCAYDLDIEYLISPEKAAEIAADEAMNEHGHHHMENLSSPIFKYDGPEVKKIIFEDDQGNHSLAYEVLLYAHILAPMKYFIDGKTGEVLNAFTTLCAMDGPVTAEATDLNGVSQTINTLLQGNNHFLADATKPMFNPQTQEGIILTYDANNTQGENAELVSSIVNEWEDPASVSAHFNAGVAYDYFFDNHQWNSINGQGGNIISLVNVSDEFGESLENAFWNGQAIFYGNGGTAFTPLAGSLDVAGHEMTHGVIQNTSNLEYQGESGAINESMADIFGFMMDQEDWQIGEDIVNILVFPSGALRDLEDPNQGGTSLRDRGFQPAHVDQQYMGTDDNGGVHINSGIPNHAFFLTATEIGNENAADVFFLALSKHLTRFSQFVDLRLACIQSAEELFGSDAQEVIAVAEAFDAVGIEEDSPSEVITSLPPSEGDEFLLSVDTDENEVNTLFRSSADGEDFVPLTTRPIINKPSVTRDGQDVYFIGSDSAIYHLDITDIQNPVETLVNDVLQWSNTAVSKDGERLAAVTGAQDTAIFVLDFNSGLWVRYTLFNPTFTEGVNAGGPIYADALEWDLSGELLVYDAFNRLGEGIDYWDVNFINVWDIENNDFGDGSIEKLFSSLPEGVSIGNPAFSKNSPFILAFDFVDGDEYAVLGVDVEKNEVSTIVQNNRLGFPNYSNLDDRIAFTTRTTDIFDQPVDIVAAIGLDETKVNSNTEAVGIINNATWPIFFVVEETGNVVTNSPGENPADELVVFPNPTRDRLNLASKSAIIDVLLTTTQGRQVPIAPISDGMLDLGGLSNGVYTLTIKTTKGIIQKKVLKE